ncbi:unnamed protein product [Toxocara canis]|uniref:Inhibitor_I29 domain-containing protein n=1 Tax=Toxocara canis TaxID=6265 RepID=A0A183VC12_TOXCA|nr:unnamed protein product [Toxocara canis]
MFTNISILFALFALLPHGRADKNGSDIEETRASYDQFLRKLANRQHGMHVDELIYCSAELEEIFNSYRYRDLNMTDDEYEMRFRIFQKNIRLINELNSGNSSIVYGITQFADWTDEEYENFTRAGEASKDRKPRSLSSDPRSWTHVRWNGQSIPSQWDWREYRAVTGIKSQSYKCNSCWAYAVTAVVESLYAIKYGQIIDISEHEMIDCDFSNNGCYSGSTRRAMGYIFLHAVNCKPT